MGRYYCEDCHVWYEREELSELQEPHGETTIWCPESYEHDIICED